MSGESGARGSISSSCAFGNFCGRECLARDPGMVGSHAGAGNPCFQASFPSAPAVRARVFVGRDPRERVVTPFAADVVWAIERPAINDDAGAASGSEDNSEDDALIPRDTINSFR